MSQSLPPGGISEDILEEPSEFSNVFGEPPGSEAECGESHVIHHDVMTPPPPKKQALDSIPHDSDKVAMETHPSSDTNEVTIETTKFAVETSPPNTDEVVTETTFPQYDNKEVSIETCVTSVRELDTKPTQDTDQETIPQLLESSKIPERELVPLANKDREMQDQIVGVHVPDVSGGGEDENSTSLDRIEPEDCTEIVDVRGVSGDGGNEDSKSLEGVGMESEVAEDVEENLEDTKDIEEDILGDTRQNLKEKDDEDIQVDIEENVIEQGAEKRFIEVEEDVLERPVETGELDNEGGNRNTDVSRDSTGREDIVPVVAPELDSEAVVEEMVEVSEAKEEDVTVQTTVQLSQSLSAHGDMGTKGVESEVCKERSAVDEKMEEDFEAKEDVTIQTTVQSPPSLPSLEVVGATEVESEEDIRKEHSEGLVDAEIKQNNRAVVQEEKYDNEHQIAAEYQLRQRHTQSSERDTTPHRTPVPSPPTVVSRGLFGVVQRRWLGWRRQSQILLLGVGGFLTVALLMGVSFLFEVV